MLSVSCLLEVKLRGVLNTWRLAARDLATRKIVVRCMHGMEFGFGPWYRQLREAFDAIKETARVVEHSRLFAWRVGKLGKSVMARPLPSVLVTESARACSRYSS